MAGSVAFRALHISRAAHRICCPRLAVHNSWLLARQLSTSLPRFTAAAAAEPITVHAQATDVSKPVPPSQVVHEEDEKAESEPVPFVTLSDKLSHRTMRAITYEPFGHHYMTHVQNAVLPMIPDLVRPLRKKADGTFPEPKGPRDLMVRAKTGTGKTLAFLVPAVEARLMAIQQAEADAKAIAGKAGHKTMFVMAGKEFAKTHVGAIILSPTRELAKQIVVEAEKLVGGHRFVVHELIGGESKGRQLRKWKENRKDIVVATTGRLRDLMESEPEIMEPIRECKFLVLDEADTMLDIGFRPDIEYITDQLPPAPERQTFIFSATISKAVQQIARQTLSKNHLFINTVGESDSPVHAHIPQFHTVLSSAKDQLPHILRLLAHDQLTNPGKSKVMIFLPTTKLTQLYSTLIRELSRAVLPAGRGTRVYELHSKKSMDSRTNTSDRFRHDDSGASVLITSDVSARGVDYPGVTRVIQVGIPSSSDQYVHRIGRTGRQGSTTQGRADLVLLPWEHGFIRHQLSEIPLKPITAHDFEKHVHEIAEKHDADPDAFIKEAEAANPPPQSKLQPQGPTKAVSPRYARRVRFWNRVAERLKGMHDEIDEALSSVVEEGEIHETFASLCGYYNSKDDELRTSRSAILEGLRDWAVHAGGLPEPPHVSETFLAKLGFMAGSRAQRVPYREKTFGQKYGQRGQTSPADRWSGRGRKPGAKKTWQEKVAKKRAKKAMHDDSRGGGDWSRRRSSW